MDQARVLPLFGVLLMCGFAVGCTSPQPNGLDAEQEAAIADTLLSITEEYNDVWEQLDSTAILQVFDQFIKFCESSLHELL